MLVLSVFPGIGLLDMAFEEAGFCVVRGPDLLWGGDIHRFHPPAGKFDGVIGGPPCQAFSSAAGRSRAGGARLAANLIPEFERVVQEARPAWWLSENVPRAPLPAVGGYVRHDVLLNNRESGGEQNRVRRFTFGTQDGRRLALPFPFAPQVNAYAPTVTANGTTWDPVLQRSQSYRTTGVLREAIRLQGLPDDFDLPPFTVAGALKAIGNGVPLPLGRAVAQAVVRALESRAA